ncbi:hypothetical protein Mycch_2214 [Mycolicibacterium chubuense NBB4]|uniref:Uncharacterized protein n=1 Tax=Mycolicibacterium chubuense (strain NBB4) TaxID=710421 RepID=I4BI90_MYCCN|nr:hypothetical protein [Mycolicibacterium chubuense]AFM16997.1 hypothetical protein Mycch_2214 [Mycolicibacterium chubuense NBB4]
MSSKPQAGPNGYQEPRPDHLPLSAAVWDASHNFGRSSQTVVQKLYDAVKQLEADVIAMRGE